MQKLWAHPHSSGHLNITKKMESLRLGLDFHVLLFGSSLGDWQ